MVNSHVENFEETWYLWADRNTCTKTFCARSSASVASRSMRYTTFITGCLYFSTNSAKAPSSPCLTRNIRAASGSISADVILIQSTKHRHTHKVAHERFSLLTQVSVFP